MILIITSLLLSSILILISVNYTKVAFALSTAFLSLVGLLFDPYIAQSNGVYTDLVRFFNELQLVKTYNLGDVLSSSVEPFKSLYSGMFVNNIIMFLVSKTGNLHLLPFLSVLAFYSILYIQLYKESKRNRLNKYSVLIILWLVYALINITGPMDNIRNPFTSLVGSILLYNNLINDLSIMNAGIGYIIIFFIHPSSIIFPILNLIVKISNKWMKYIFVIATFVFFIFSYQISSILLRIVPSGSTFSDVVNKLNSYSGGQADLISYGTITQKAILWLTAIVMIFVLYFFNKQTKSTMNRFSDACIFFITIFVATSLFSVHMFFRFGFILSILILLMLPTVFRATSNNFDYNFHINSRIPISYFSLYILLIITIVINLSWYFGTYAYQSINLGGMISGFR